MKIVSIDPGTSTGWCLCDSSHRPVVLSFGTDKGRDIFYNTLMAGDFNDVDRAIVEDYRIRPANLQRGFAHQWNDAPALRVIGAIEYWAHSYSIPITFQQPAIKPAAAGMTGVPYKKGKANAHHLDAMLHGLYFLIKSGKITQRDVRNVSA